MEDNKTLDEMLAEGAEEKATPRPFVIWTVGGKEYRLKLQASVITTLEARFKKSLFMAVVDDGLPQVQTIIDILQGAMQKYHHGFTAVRVEGLYDDYIDEGHTIYDILEEVLFPLLADVGFFTKEQLAGMQSDVRKIGTTL